MLNETLTIYHNHETDCPDCGYDPIRKESTNLNCQTCDGIGKIIDSITYTIPSSIETEEDFSFDYANVGRISNGEILATIDSLEIKTILNTDGKYSMDNYQDIKKFLDQYDYFEWKGAKYVLKSFQPGYLQGNFYEISMTLSLKE